MHRAAKNLSVNARDFEGKSRQTFVRSTREKGRKERVKRTVDDRNLLLRKLPRSLEVPNSSSFTERLDLVCDLSSEPFSFGDDGVLGDDRELSEGDD